MMKTVTEISTRLPEAGLRQEDSIWPHSELRLSRRSFAGNKRTAEAYRRHLRRFEDACRTGLESIEAIDNLLRLEVNRDADVSRMTLCKLSTAPRERSSEF
jgi:hypothetical protein